MLIDFVDVSGLWISYSAKKTQKVLGCCEPNLKTYICFLPFYLQNLFFERKLIVYINFFRFCTLDNWTEKRYWNDDLFEFLECLSTGCSLKIVFFPLNFVIFLNSASSAAALVFYLPGVCTHTDTEGKQSSEYF